MTLESGFTFFIAIFIFGITPGPGTFALLGRSLTHEAKSCLPLAFGMTISDSIYLIMACLGLSAIAEHWGTAFTIIRLVGAAYLIYLGWKMWTAPIDTEFKAKIGRSDLGFALFMQGVLISASNPKVILFYIAFLPTFMDLSILRTQDIFTVVMLDMLALMLSLMLVVYGAARAKKTLTSTTALKRLNRTAGSIMAGAGVFLATRSS